MVNIILIVVIILCLNLLIYINEEENESSVSVLKSLKNSEKNFYIKQLTTEFI